MLKNMELKTIVNNSYSDVHKIKKLIEDKVKKRKTKLNEYLKYNKVNDNITDVDKALYVNMNSAIKAEIEKELGKEVIVSYKI